MSQTIGLSTSYSISQDTSIAGEDLPAFDYDYQIPVTFSSDEELATADESLNNLFSTRTYQQDDPVLDTYTVVLTVDQVALKTLLVSSTWYGSLTTGTASCPTTGAADAGTVVLGERLLEIMALKLFGHAGARSAILNDSEYLLEALLDSIIAGIAANVVTDKDLIFGQYVNLGRITGEDVSATHDFDFSNLKMRFPLYLDGSLSENVSSLLANKTGLGSDFSSGVYHIPISLLLDGSTIA